MVECQATSNQFSDSFSLPNVLFFKFYVKIFEGLAELWQTENYFLYVKFN